MHTQRICFRIGLGAYGLLVGHDLGLQQQAELVQILKVLDLVSVHLRHRDELRVEVEFIILGDGVDDITYLPVHLEAVLSFDAYRFAMQLSIKLT